MEFQYTVIRSKRKSVSIEVSPDCDITVRVPYRLSQKEIDGILESKREWLQNAVSKQLSKPKIKDYSPEEIDTLRNKAKLVIPQKVDYYSKIMQVYPSAVKINSAKKRYGSCNAQNGLNFSLYLMTKDEKFIDYVVVHELAHIKHHNHSKDFYAFLSEFMPDYKEIVKKYK